jgi:hypothetical protein
LTGLTLIPYGMEEMLEHLDPSGMKEMLEGNNWVF